MKRINAGRLCAIGYDMRKRSLRVEFEDGMTIDYSAVGTGVWRQFSTASSPLNYYRDNIEEKFLGRRGTVQLKGRSQLVADLFKSPREDGNT